MNRNHIAPHTKTARIRTPTRAGPIVRPPGRPPPSVSLTPEARVDRHAASETQYPHTFATAGTFNYRCTIHPTCANLNGTIVVVGAGVAIQNRVLGISLNGGSSGGIYGGGTCAALSLVVDSVHVGDQVVWTSASPLPHTVTSR